ncbi:MAG: DUF4974 domain-containing protein [Cyclobacteriaceae bacterium]|nr:DUF4974 domain-containing protein [Cyclobacteriaceae bacterium]
MDYKDFKLEDFLRDKNFIHWVVKPDEGSNIFWKNWLESHPDQAKNALRAKNIIQSLKFDVPQKQTRQFERVLQNILKNSPQIHEKRDFEIKRHRHGINQWMIRIAASFFFLITFGILLYLHQPVEKSVEKPVEEKYITKSNPRGKKSTLTLPDSTRVILNDESTIRVSSNFMNQRVVELEGEAYFEVRRNTELGAFTVKSGDLQTKVLGTTFSVKAYSSDKNISVLLNTGKVVVEHVKGNRQELLPGEKIKYTSQTGMKKSKFDRNTDLAWKDGILIFKGAGLNEFKNTLERWYDVKVVVRGKPAETWSINGKFNNEELRVVLESLKYTQEIDYEWTDNIVTIKF